ncbi:extracellular solute-binding protein [Paenibacillus filicis]|uniref:Extracellular solute-binding protein n=1 Tax=Paenibacillus gyeongsangnamensis TaxID=3388067 RepID=A0ABT4Q5S6_9BACL|nr:extracellular solute-binding protein [Paenibacillus filicis]MCZ8512223.1 extracellular solute-binding protein [Paenibacillus filicis]
MRKQIASSFLIGFLGLAAMLSGCSSTTATNQSADSAKGKSSATKEITVWSFTDEAKYAIQKFQEKYPDTKVNFVYIAGDQYQTKLNSALQTGAQAPDVFAMENGFVRKFIDNPALTDLAQFNAKDLITKQYPYIQATEKDSKGNIKAIGYQGTPGGFYYRRDLAKQYIGTDDPDKVSEAISSWDKVMQLGQKVAQESNGKIHAFAHWNAIMSVNNGSVKEPWVKDGKLIIDQARLNGLDVGKKAYDTNIAAKLESGSPAEYATMQNGEVMFYPGPTWYLQYVLKKNAPKTSGQWGLAHGPGAFYGGGTFYGIYNKSKNQDAAWKFINFYSFDQDFLKQLGKEQTYFTSNKEVNTALAPEVKDDFIGGQKYFEFFNVEGDKVPSVTRSKYDGDIDTIFGKDVLLYMKGDIKTRDELIVRFKKDVKHDFPELNVD